MGLRISGEWPGQLVLRRGWAKAEARPWNDAIEAAQLKLVRGGRAFLAECTEHLLTMSEAVISPPLLPGQARPWRSAGYRTFLRLTLYRRTLTGRLPPDAQDVSEGSPTDWPAVLEVDRAAFAPIWRVDEAGLREALEATPETALLLARSQPGGLKGFAVVGRSGSTSYLQRVAVHPDSRRTGTGRALVRASLRWAHGRGASIMLLNTQPENVASEALYRSEGFRPESGRLVVLRRDGVGTSRAALGAQGEAG